VRSISLYRTVDFCALRRWHRFHSHRSLDDRVSPSYFLRGRKMKTYNKIPRQCRCCHQNSTASRSKTARNDHFRTNTGTTKSQDFISMWCRASRYSLHRINLTAAPIGRALQHSEATDEGDRGDGPGCGNGRDEAGGAARAAGSDKRRCRSGSCVGIHRSKTSAESIWFSMSSAATSGSGPLA
jgi:hypothetical protein